MTDGKQQNINGKLIAAIAAAAYSALGRPVRVKRITPVAVGPLSPWTLQGRIAVQSSHNLHRRSL
jgi:hypothetical protein